LVIGHRENFNAHGFDVANFYFSSDKSANTLDILTFWDDRQNTYEHKAY